MKKYISKGAIIVGLIFTGFILFSVFHNMANERYSVEFFKGSNHKYYENTPDAAQIDVSPKIAWEHTPAINKWLGWIFLIVMWGAIWYVDTDRYLGKRRANNPGGQRNGLAVVLILIPLLLCATFFFAGYSSRLDNTIVVERSQFDSWLNTGAIEQKGEKTYIDKADTIRNRFKTHVFIR